MFHPGEVNYFNPDSISVHCVYLQQQLLYMHFSSLLKGKPAVSCPLQFLVNTVHK